MSIPRSFIIYHRFDVQKRFQTDKELRGCSDAISQRINSVRSARSASDHRGSFLEQSAEEFLLRCNELYTNFRLRSPDHYATQEVKRKLHELESRIYVAADLTSSSRLDLCGKAVFLVRLKLKRERLARDRKHPRSQPNQSERMSFIGRTYESHRPKPRALSCTAVSEVTYDTGYYKISRLLDEIAATKSLPENQLVLTGLELTDAHISLICRRSKCNLQRICKLDLSGNHISDASKISALLSHSRHLAYVSLRDNRFSTTGVITLAQAVLNKPSVVGIDVSRNGIDRNELKHFLAVEHDRINRNRPGGELELFRCALGKILIDRDTTCLDLINTLENVC